VRPVYTFLYSFDAQPMHRGWRKPARSITLEAYNDIQG